MKATEILLDLNATIINPEFYWPEYTSIIGLKGFKYSIWINNAKTNVFGFRIHDSDDFEIDLDPNSIFIIRDWIVENVLPHYLILD